MINQDKWINSLPTTNIKLNEETNQIAHDKCVNTISKKNTAGTAIPCLTILCANFEISCLSDWVMDILLSIMLISFLNLHEV